MADRLSASVRSKVMSNIQGRNTKPEIILRRRLWHAGLRYRVHVRIPGSPDIVFRRQKIAVFVDGCFWHGCPIHYKRPTSNQPFWDNKLRENMERDERVDRSLIDDGWVVLHYWEHEINSSLELCANEIVQLVRNMS